MSRKAKPLGSVAPSKAMTEGDDRINPTHYRSHPSGLECIVVTRHFNFNLGNVIKYIWRHGQKPDASAIEDLKKARWYLDDEIKRLESEDV